MQAASKGEHVPRLEQPGQQQPVHGIKVLHALRYLGVETQVAVEVYGVHHEDVGVRQQQRQLGGDLARLLRHPRRDLRRGGSAEAVGDEEQRPLRVLTEHHELLEEGERGARGPLAAVHARDHALVPFAVRFFEIQ